MEKSRKMKEEREREELLNRRFTVNKDTAIYIDYSVEHQKSLQVIFIFILKFRTFLSYELYIYKYK